MQIIELTKFNMAEYGDLTNLTMGPVQLKRKNCIHKRDIFLEISIIDNQLWYMEKVWNLFQNIITSVIIFTLNLHIKVRTKRTVKMYIRCQINTCKSIQIWGYKPHNKIKLNWIQLIWRYRDIITSFTQKKTQTLTIIWRNSCI